MHAKTVLVLTHWGILAAIGAALGLGICSCKREARQGPRRFDEEFSYKAEGIDLTLTVRGTEISLAGLVELVFEIKHASDVEVEIAQIEGWRGEFELYALVEEPGRMIDGGRGIIRRVVYSLEPQRAGDYLIDKIKVDYWHTDRPLLRDSMVMEPFSVQVYSLVYSLVGENTNAADILDIEGPWIPKESKHYWGLAALVAVVCGCGLVWFFRREKLEEVIEQEVETAPAAGEIAMRELTKLLDERLYARGLFDPFFVRLSDIVRQYIESKFDCPVLSQTTEEFLTAISQEDVFDKEQKKMLGRFLTQCDRVKFAGIAVSPEFARVSGENCKCFIMTTMVERR
ncbi:MAG: hypothetical protein IIC50_01885 [Planctomycetes bacterium]|nr:hypothetical protein [Planctomycetota bacterium]